MYVKKNVMIFFKILLFFPSYRDIYLFSHKKHILKPLKDTTRIWAGHFIINYLCDDFVHLQLINLCDTKILTDDCLFLHKKTKKGHRKKTMADID